MSRRITIHKLPLNYYTLEGAYWAKVDGENIGEGGRTHWPTYDDAHACAVRFIAARELANPIDPSAPTPTNAADGSSLAGRVQNTSAAGDFPRRSP